MSKMIIHGLMRESLSSLKTHLPKPLSNFLRNSRVLSPLRIDYAVDAEKGQKRGIENFRVLSPQVDVFLCPTENEWKFLKICKYFNDGHFCRPKSFVCEVPGAFCHI